jgi:hypothetical protein
MTRWEQLVARAVAAIVEQRADDFEVPDEIADLFPGTPEQCRLFVLSCGFEVWIRSLHQ